MISIENVERLESVAVLTGMNVKDVLNEALGEWWESTGSTLIEFASGVDGVRPNVLPFVKRENFEKQPLSTSMNLSS